MGIFGRIMASYYVLLYRAGVAKWQLFEPFEKLKNYIENLRMVSSNDLF